MKKLFFSFFSLFLLMCCSNSKINTTTPKIKGIIIERLFPVLDFDSLTDTWFVKYYYPYYSRIYFYDKNIMIQTSFMYRSSHYPDMKPETIKNVDENSKFVQRYYSIVFSREDSLGFFCDSNNLNSFKLVKKDSLLQKEWAFGPERSGLIEDNLCDLLSSTVNADGDIEETYSMGNKADTSIKGTVLLVFSSTKMKGVDYYLNKRIEEKRKMKLIKVLYTTFARRSEIYNANFGEAEVPYEVREIAIDNETEIKEMFEFAKNKLQYK